MYSNYGYGDYGSASGTSPVVTIIYLLIMAANIVALWRIFIKAGEPGWAAIVPFYNIFVLFKITWGNGLRFLLMIIPFYNIVLGIQTMLKLAQSFGKSTGFAVGLILLGPVFLLLLAFGDARYTGIPGQPANAPYGQNYPQQDYPQNAYPQQQAYQPQNTYQQQQSYQQSQNANPQQPNYQPAPDQTQLPAYCPYCGQAVAGKVKFCTGCGQKLA